MAAILSFLIKFIFYKSKINEKYKPYFKSYLLPYTIAQLYNYKLI